MPLTKTAVEALCAPFADDAMGVKVQSLNNRDKDLATKAMLVLYLQHTDVMNRLDSVDPNWSTESLGAIVTNDLVTVRMKMTVLGVTRENVGDGSDQKGAYSDALKRCAMLFGVGRYLYDSQQVWVSYNAKTDKYKQWTMAEYNRALGNRDANAVSGVSTETTHAGATTQPPAPHDPAKPGAYVVTFGKYAGKTLAEVGPQLVLSDLTWWKNNLAQKNEKPKGKLSAHLAAMEAYVAQNGSMVSNMTAEEDVPFNFGAV